MQRKMKSQETEGRIRKSSKPSEKWILFSPKVTNILCFMNGIFSMGM